MQPPPSGPRPMRGPNFSYLLPPGWRVGEEGPFALVLRSPDMLASIIVYGQSGLLAPMSPEQFAYHVMAGVMRLAPDIRLSQGRPIQPQPGYTHAAVMETTYTVMAPQGPVPIRGIVICNVAIGYGTCNATMTLAGSEARQWEHYQSWLPQVAAAAVNTGPNAYGSTAMAQTMHNITAQEQQAYTSYNNWSQENWEGVVDARNASIDRQQGALDNMLTGQEWMADPYGNPMQRRSTTPAAIWVSRDGREVTSDNATYDPRTPFDSDWRRVR